MFFCDMKYFRGLKSKKKNITRLIKNIRPHVELGQICGKKNLVLTCNIDFADMMSTLLWTLE